MTRRGLPDPVKVALVNRLDPDGRLRDIIDEALRRYHQRRSVDEGTPPPSHEGPSNG